MFRVAGLAFACAALMLPGARAAAPPVPARPVTAASVIESAPAGDWAAFDPQDLIVMDLADGTSVVIALAPMFAPIHVANIRAIVRAGWFDGLAIDRVDYDYVVQWGDIDGRKPPPPGIVAPVPPEYTRSGTGLALRSIPYRDPYATRIGLIGAFPVAIDRGEAWPAHCYGTVGIGRDLNPDTGTGAELYAVTTRNARGLDRNIAVAGRVIDGMAHLTDLPRGTAAMGFYAKPEQRTGIVRMRIMADLPPAARTIYHYLRPDSASFAAWLHARANREDSFYLRPAGALDLCSAVPPVRAER